MKHIYKHLIVFIIAVGIIFLSFITQAFINEGLEFIQVDFRFATKVSLIYLMVKAVIIYFILFYWLHAYSWFKDLSDRGAMCSSGSGSVGCDPVPTLRHQHEQIYILTHIIEQRNVDSKSKMLANNVLHKLLEQEFIQSSAVNGAPVSAEPESDTLPEN